MQDRQRTGGGLHPHVLVNVLFGTYPWKGGLDLLRIVMVGLAKNLPERKEGHELHRLLGALLTNKLSVEERLTILEQDYGVPMDEQYKRGSTLMRA